ncbi:MAG: DUF4249 domain-containing protein [Dysgonamonadaceae bacterium]|jgi:hypothetical protein|nr:DUF4249 domain-containing protein [Dysgonamonadaceae bacterium]
MHPRHFQLSIFNFQFIILSLLLVACNEDRAIAYVEYEPKIAVEGYIESGQPPIVMLSWTGSFEQSLDTTYLLKHVITAAKVSVSDGETTEVLTLGTNRDYLPPYVYYGNILKGEPGKTYRLEIEYHNRLITAETTIPQPVALDSCWFVQETPNSTIGYAHIRFKNVSGAYYQVATRVATHYSYETLKWEKTGETVFTPCLYGNFPASQFPANDTVEMQINKGPILFLYAKTQFNTYFLLGDRVEIKLRTQTKEAYDFWSSWQSEILNARNPIFPATNNLQSNINGNAIGVWCGYGVSKTFVIFLL